MLPDAPVTVANFAAYARAGDYTDVFFHRNAWLDATTPFVIQAGGYRWPATAGIRAVASRGAIVNEFSPTRSNVRGTVAMAKPGGDPNSATSQWFINMGNNAANLDAQKGGFTVFARVTGPGMATADRIAALPNVNAGSPFDTLPVTAGKPAPACGAATWCGSRAWPNCRCRRRATASSTTSKPRIRSTSARQRRLPAKRWAASTVTTRPTCTSARRTARSGT